MSLFDHPAFATYEPVPTTRYHRQQAVELHVPAAEQQKPEMRRFIDGIDSKVRPHLTATAQAIARAELRVHESYRNPMQVAQRMYNVWSFLTLWSTFEGRSIEWDRPQRKRRPRVWQVWASVDGNTKAYATGREPYDAAEKLAEKLRLL